MLNWIKNLLSDLSFDYILYTIIALLLVALAVFYRAHTNDLKKIAYQSNMIESQGKTIDSLKRDYDIAEKINAQNQIEKKQIREETSHETKVINRYFKIYKNDCANSAMPRSVVKRLRQDATAANTDNKTSFTGSPTTSH